MYSGATRACRDRHLGGFPLDVVRNECERCGRAGRYAKARLIERFGADACGARFTDLVARR
jgi:hypothetical protein